MYLNNATGMRDVTTDPLLTHCLLVEKVIFGVRPLRHRALGLGFELELGVEQWFITRSLTSRQVVPCPGHGHIMYQMKHSVKHVVGHFN